MLELIAGVTISFLFALGRLNLKEVMGEAGKDFSYDATFSRPSFKTHRNKRAFFLRAMSKDRNEKLENSFGESLLRGQ